MRSIVAFSLLLTALVPIRPASSFADDYVLDAAVIMSRHGVRAPLADPQGSPPMSAYASDPWPSFDVKAGYLTPQGFSLAKLMGGFYGDYFAEGGLIPSGSCPAASEISVRADSDQRTIQTGKALLEGMFPGCSYRVRHVKAGQTDPLFDPVRGGICTLPSPEVDYVNANLGGSYSAAAKAYTESLSALQDVLQCCKPAACKYAGLGKTCTLTDTATPTKQDSFPIGPASSVSENFIMEYADGMPLANVGWGRFSSSEEISFVNMSHALEFWAGNTSPVESAYYGSNLAYHMLRALQTAALGKGPKLTIYVAHDNNLLNIAGLLGVNWFLESYQQNQVPPGAGLSFELWRDTTTNQYWVAVRLHAQTLSQLRDATVLDTNTPPAEAHLTDIACKFSASNGFCPLTQFAATLSAAILPACVSRSGR